MASELGTLSIMSILEYLKLDEINPKDFVCLLNKQKVREHLIEHELFVLESVESWVKQKMEVDSIPGCKVRAIITNAQLIGWCGIQLENEKYEVAFVIDEKFWGIGKVVFQEIIRWAMIIGHDELFIHFHHTRPEYKFLRKISKNVYKSELLGSKFTTYQIAIQAINSGSHL